MKEAMTVAEFIDKLGTFDPDALVMIECEDPCYSGPLTEEEIKEGQAVEVTPHEYESGGGWQSLGLDEDDPAHWPIVGRRKCVILSC